MDAGLFIAFRYLFAKKSHNVINVISAISAAGIAIGTAALILILSVYNGFDGIIRANLSDLSPDLLVTSADGGLFAPEGAGFDRLREDGRIVSFACVLEKNVFVTYGDRQGIARAKGVDRSYEESTPLASHVTAGTFSLHRGELAQVSVGAGMAYDMGINPCPTLSQGRDGESASRPLFRSRERESGRREPVQRQFRDGRGPDSRAYRGHAPAGRER